MKRAKTKSSRNSDLRRLLKLRIKEDAEQLQTVGQAIAYLAGKVAAKEAPGSV